MKKYYSLFLCCFYLSYSPLHAQTLNTKINFFSFVRGAGGMAEITIGKHWSVGLEYQHYKYNFKHSKGSYFLFPLAYGSHVISGQNRGDRVNVLFRWFPEGTFNGWFLEAGTYAGKYSSTIKESNSSTVFLFITQNEYDYLEQNNVRATGLKFGIGFDQNTDFLNVEYSGGFSRNFNKLNSRAGYLARKETFYLRIAIGGAITIRRKNKT